MPKPDVEAIAQSAAVTAVNRLSNEYLGKITDKIDSGLSKSYSNGQSKATSTSHDDASAINSRLGRIEDSIAIRNKTVHKKGYPHPVILSCRHGCARLNLELVRFNRQK